MTAPRLLAFAGSARTDSFNKRLARLAAARARGLGAEVVDLDLRDLDLPLYDGDLEAEHGLPEGARTLKAAMDAADGLLLACPEYNGSVTPLLNNAIDWASRPLPDEKPLAAYAGKTALLVAASPGALGGLRGLVHVRAILSGIGVHVVPSQVAIPKAHELLTEEAVTAGALADERLDGALTRAVTELVETTRKLRG